MNDKISSGKRKEEINKNSKTIKQDGLIYMLKEEDETADVIGHDDDVKGDILIPRSIIYESKEYIISGLLKDSFNNSRSIRSIRFPPDSELQIIESGTFSESDIESISIPSSILKIEDGWCRLSLPKKVTIIPTTKQQNISYCNDDESVIVGKTDNNKDEYDVLLFVNRDVKKVTIPPNIKQIASFAFSRSLIESIVIPPQITRIGRGAFSCCFQLQRVEISPDSSLQEIEDNVFQCCSIESIFIPPHVKRIGEEAFIGCKRLKDVNLSKESELQIIGKDAFTNTSIESFNVPRHVTQICERAFSLCKKLKCIDFDVNSELQTIQPELFAWSSIEKLTIPSSVCNFESGWCNGLFDLKKVVISPNNHYFMNIDDKMIIGKSDLNSDDYDVLLFVSQGIEKVVIPSFIKQISDFSFSNSLIKSILIPSHVKRICKSAFSGCKQLEFVEFEKNSELETIEDLVFEDSSIKRLKIPSCVMNFSDEWCKGANQLVDIEVFQSKQNNNNINIKCDDCKILCGKTNKESDDFDVLLFAGRDIKTLITPPSIKIIAPFAFSESSIESVFVSAQLIRISKNAFCSCEDLRRIEIPFDSKLQFIDDEAFASTSIESIFIPRFVTRIGYNAFGFCSKLRRIEIPPDSMLQEIGYLAFRSSGIDSIYIPSHVTRICEFPFIDCKNLNIMEFDENTEMELIDIKKINYCQNKNKINLIQTLIRGSAIIKTI